jgi:hypothetical protein
MASVSSDKPHQRFLEIGPLQVKHYRMSGLKKYQQRVLSRFFSLLLPLPTAAFSTITAKRKATAKELEARAESNGYKRKTHREEESTRDNEKHNKKTKRNQNSVLDRYVL